MDLATLYCPSFFEEELVGADVEIGRKITSVLGAMGRNVKDFRNLLQLYAYAALQLRELGRPAFPHHLFDAPPEDRDRLRLEYDRERDDWNDTERVFRTWELTAIKSAATFAYAQHRSFQHLGYLLAAAPVIDAKIDKQLRNAAQRRLDAAFPDISKVRLMAAHPEFSANPRVMEDHALDGRIYIGDNLSDGVFEGSVGKKMVRFELSDRTTHEIEAATVLMWRAFYPVEKPFFAQCRVNDQAQYELLYRSSPPHLS